MSTNFSNWFKGSSPLQLAIERGLKQGGDLVAELDELDDYTPKSKGDAKAICEALRQMDAGRIQRPRQGRSPLYTIAGLFQDTESGSDACEFLRLNGTPLLIRLARKAWKEEDFDSSELLFVLKMLAAYGTPEGAGLVIEVARSGFTSEGYLWSVVLRMFEVEHPEARRVFAALSDPLPEKFLAVSLLDAVNHFCLNGGELRHPFDSDEGVRRLEAWLRDADPEKFSYAVSATAALPFLQHPRQDMLFQIAFGHSDGGVQLEAAWAAAKLDRPSGWEKMATLCRDVHHSSRAKTYLRELGREDVIPEDSKRPDFEAKAEFAQWLAHPNELGRPPDELEILDHRDLRWPTDGEVKHMWLIRFRAKDTTGLASDQTGVGLVGSITFCLFSDELDQRHAEDAYAIHCYWEMANHNRITESDVEEPSDYDSLLQQWNGPRLEEAKLIAVSEPGADTSYPRRLVGLASAKIGGMPGWAVLDGPESKWYPADDLPEGHRPNTLLKIHIGRRLLGFKGEPDRKLYLKKPEKPAPEQIECAYEKLLAEAESAGASRRKRLFGGRGGGLLGNYFEDYIEAKRSLHGGNPNLLFTELYERLLGIARSHPDEASALLNIHTPLGDSFQKYVDAQAALQRQSEIVALIELFAPHWEHNLGYGELGSAAIKAGRDDIAEKFFLQFKEKCEDWQRSARMSQLAEIQHRLGKSDEARSLLIECMRKMLEDGRKAEGSDRKLFEEWFQNHRKTFRELFPGESLAAYGLPETTAG